LSPDIIILDGETEDTLGALSQDSPSLDMVADRYDDSTLTQSFSSANVSDDFYDGAEPEWRSGIKVMGTDPLVVTPLNFSAPPLPTSNNDSPVMSDSEVQWRAQANKEMKSALRDKIILAKVE
jgi:hypothetical protein